MAAAAGNTFVVFAGGATGSAIGSVTNVLDIYTPSTNTMTSQNVGNNFMAGAAAGWGDTVFIAGGNSCNGALCYQDRIISVMMTGTTVQIRTDGFSPPCAALALPGHAQPRQT